MSDDEPKPRLTRRSFLFGAGAVTVGLLFAKQLDRVLAELEGQSAAELSEIPVAADQLPSAITITSRIMGHSFRPERLMISAGMREVVRLRNVPVTKLVACEVCQGSGCGPTLEDPEVDAEHDLDDWDSAPDCEACLGAGGSHVDTGLREDRDEEIIPWVIEDIHIGGERQLAGGEGIAGDFFAPDAIDSFVNFSAMTAETDLVLRARYIGQKPEGAPFWAAMIGSGQDEHGRLVRRVLPINSGGVRVLPS